MQIVAALLASRFVYKSRAAIPRMPARNNAPRKIIRNDAARAVAIKKEFAKSAKVLTDEDLAREIQPAGGLTSVLPPSLKLAAQPQAVASAEAADRLRATSFEKSRRAKTRKLCHDKRGKSKMQKKEFRSCRASSPRSEIPISQILICADARA